jgi:hypothetical protein
MYILHIVIFLFLVAGSSLAQLPKPIFTDRPDQTESPLITPKYYFQIESGLSYSKEDKYTIVYSHPSTLFRYGIFSGVELRVEAEAKSLRSGGGNTCTGIEPLSAGFKVHLFDERGIIPLTSLLGSISLPFTATRIFRGTDYIPGFKIAMLNNISDIYQISYNIGADFEGEHLEPAFLYSLSNGFSINDRTGAFIEIFGFFSKDSEADHQLDAGISYLLSDDSIADLSGGIGLTSSAPQYFIAIGFSFRFRTC